MISENFFRTKHTAERASLRKLLASPTEHFYIAELEMNLSESQYSKVWKRARNYSKPEDPLEYLCSRELKIFSGPEEGDSLILERRDKWGKAGEKTKFDKKSHETVGNGSEKKL